MRAVEHYGIIRWQPPASARFPVEIGSSVLLSVISFHVMWANAQAQGSDDLDHERDMTLAIHAAIPDLIRDTIVTS
jgi:hypothetical protein